MKAKHILCSLYYKTCLMDNVGIVIQKFFDTISARRAEMEECLENKAKCVFYGGNLRK